MKFTVADYNTLWPSHFLQIKHTLEYTLRDVPYTSIEHVGSTSVPLLPAKPIIDIDIIAAASDIPAITAALTSPEGGYECRGEMGIPGRYVFRLVGEWSGGDGKGTPKRNLYVCVEGGLAVRNHLAVREVCRGDEEVRRVYGQRKRELAEREWRHVDEYTEAKNEVLGWILGKAGLGDVEREEIVRLNLAPAEPRTGS